VVRKLADVGVAKNAAIPVPIPVMLPTATLKVCQLAAEPLVAVIT
jgi:hypothetical protein